MPGGKKREIYNDEWVTWYLHSGNKFYISKPLRMGHWHTGSHSHRLRESPMQECRGYWNDFAVILFSNSMFVQTFGRWKLKHMWNLLKIYGRNYACLHRRESPSFRLRGCWFFWAARKLPSNVQLCPLGMWGPIDFSDSRIYRRKYRRSIFSIN